MVLRSIINYFNVLFPPVPRVRTEEEERMDARIIVAGYGGDNFYLKQGKYTTQEDYEDEKRKVLQYNFLPKRKMLFGKRKNS